MALPRWAIVGSSRSRMYRPGPRNSSPLGTASAAPAIFTPGPKVLPPSVDRKIHSDRCSGVPVRSEEHTSELQSRPHLVCRLLLEKKKKQERCDTPGKHNNILTI